MVRKKKTRWGDRVTRRQDILDAASQLLERDGYGKLSMRDVAEVAGVSPGTLYTYYPSKQALFAFIYSERLVELREELERQVAGLATVEDVVFMVADRYFDVHRVFGHEFDVWSAVLDGASLSPETVGQLVEATQSVFSTVRAAIARIEPALDGPEMELAQPVLQSTITGLAEHFASLRHLLHPHTREELTHMAARIFVAGLRQELRAPGAEKSRREASGLTTFLR